MIRTSLAALLALVPSVAFAQSTIDPTYPPSSGQLSSAGIRSQFQKAIADINAAYVQPVINIPAVANPAIRLKASGNAPGTKNWQIYNENTQGSLVLSPADDTFATFPTPYVFSRAAPAWGTNFQVYSGFLSNIGNLPTASMLGGTAVAGSTEQSLGGALDVPANDTGTFLSVATAGHVRTNNSTSPGVGVFAGAMAGPSATGGILWAINSICTNAPAIITATQTGRNAVSCTGYEADINYYKLSGGGTPSGTARGVWVVGGSEVVPSGGAYAMEVSPFGSPPSGGAYLPWSVGLQIDGQPSTYGINIGTNSYTNAANSPSQIINFNNSDAGGVVRNSSIGSDATGNLVLTPVAGQGVKNTSLAGSGTRCLQTDNTGLVAVATTICAGSAGGTSGQIQYNNAGALGGFTASGDATINTGTGAVTLASLLSAGGPTGSATTSPIITYDAKGRLTAVSSATITPAIASITGLGTGIATALAVNTGSAGAPVLFNGAGGTPTSLNLSNATNFGTVISWTPTVGCASSGTVTPGAVSGTAVRESLNGRNRVTWSVRVVVTSQSSCNYLYVTPPSTPLNTSGFSQTGYNESDGSLLETTITAADLKIVFRYPGNLGTVLTGAAYSSNGWYWE